MNEKIFSTTVAGMEISLTRKTKKTFVVEYYLQKEIAYDYNEAAKELGYCIMHALQCDGKLD